MKAGLKKVAVVVGLALVLTASVLIGCGGSVTSTPASLAEAYVSNSLPTTYDGAVPAATQLVLGTFLLEGTANAVSPEQAKVLLPLWKSLQSGAAQTAGEVNGVLRQVERAMTPQQLQAIAAMELTQEDIVAWSRQHGADMGPGGAGGFPGAMPGGTPGAWPRGTPGAGYPGGGSSGARETQRAAYMATMQAGGMPAGGPGGRMGQGGAGAGQFRLLLPALIELLTQRAGSS